MAEEKQPITIKKYANRRLYNTGTSTYVTLDDLATMLKDGENFVVFDAKTSEDITRSVMAQSFPEQSMSSLTSQQGKFREQITQAVGAGGFGTIEEQVRRNMEMFEKTFAMFAPFAQGQAKSAADKPAAAGGEMDELKQQLDDMQKKLDKLGG